MVALLEEAILRHGVKSLMATVNSSALLAVLVFRD